MGILNIKDPDVDLTMDISGTVFLDVATGKIGQTDGVYTGSDTLMKGIEVTLCDTSGNKVVRDGLTNPVRSDDNGQYSFTGLNAMKKYIVKFTYNGQDYINTDVMSDEIYESAKQNGYDAVESWQQYSKAQEDQTGDITRDALNSRFATIYAAPNSYTRADGTTNTAYSDEVIEEVYNDILEAIEQGNNTSEEIREYLEINKADKYGAETDGANKLNFVEDCEIVAYSEKYPAMNKFNISDTSSKKYTVDYSEGRTIYPAENYPALYEGQKQINFGLKERPNVDLELIEDVKDITVNINDKTTIYKYDQYLSNRVGVRDTDISQSDYVQDIEVADYASAEDLSDKQLGIYVKFKFKIENMDSGYAKINKLINHYDSRYYQYDGTTYKYIDEDHNLVTAPTVYIGDADGNITGKATARGLETYTDFGDTRYNQLEITLESEDAKVLENGQGAEYVYLVLKLADDASTSSALVEYFGENDEGAKLANFTEIYEYTTDCVPQGEDTKLYKGLVDKDSIAGNFVPGGATEDDDWVAPSIVYKLKTPRTLAGNVFEDTTVTDTSEITSPSVKDNNSGIKNVKVELIELVRTDDEKLMEQPAKVYNEDGTPGVNVLRTDDNGDYKFTGYIPGNYVVKFTYGDNEQLSVDPTYNGQDYQSAKANPDTNKVRYWYAELDSEGNYKTDENGTILSNTTRYSDAYDEINARTSAINYVRTESMNGIDEISINNSKAEILNAGTRGGTGSITDLAEKQVMTAYTSTLELEVEMAQKGQEFSSNKPYDIVNIDFGLVKRAPSVVKVEKTIKHIKIVQTDNTVLLDTEVEYDDNGKISFNQGSDKVHLQYIDTKNAYGVGAAKLEIDDEIIIGSIDITYNIKVTDESPNGNDKIRYYKNTDDSPVAIGYYGEDANEIVYYENSGNILYHNGSNASYEVYSGLNDDRLIANKVDNIIDYVSNNLRFDSDKNTDEWTLVTETEISNILKTGDTNALIESDVQDTFDQYNQKVIASGDNPLLKLLANNEDERFATDRASRECEIILSATNTQDVDLDYYNAVEILQLDNTAGRVDTESTPGNLDPIKDYMVEIIKNNEDDYHNTGKYYQYNENKYTAGSQPNEFDSKKYELDSSKSHYIVITDATGDTHYYYVLIGSMLVIFAIGIVCIKKFVLNKR